MVRKGDALNGKEARSEACVWAFERSTKKQEREKERERERERSGRLQEEKTHRKRREKRGGTLSVEFLFPSSNVICIRPLLRLALLLYGVPCFPLSLPSCSIAMGSRALWAISWAGISVDNNGLWRLIRNLKETAVSGREDSMNMSSECNAAWEKIIRWNLGFYGLDLFQLNLIPTNSCCSNPLVSISIAWTPIIWNC